MCQVRGVLILQPQQRSDDHLKLLMNLFNETRFFKQLSSALMQRQVCRNLQMDRSSEGETLFEEGEPGDVFYMIVRGTVQGSVPTQSRHGPKTRKFELSAGDTFGDLAVTGRTENDRKRTATMRCKDECLFATLTRAGYLKVSGQLEENAYAVLRKDPHRRKEADLALLSSFFAELDFFKELHFPLLQSAVNKNMTLRALDAKEVLFEQKEWSDGVFYILLRGRLKVEVNDEETGRYAPVQEFGTSPHALSIDPDKGDDVDRLRCDRSVTAMAQRQDQIAQNKIRIDGFPRAWKSQHVFEVFKAFGKIDSVQVLSFAPAAEDKQFEVDRWAIITFAHEETARKASRESVVVALDEESQLPIVRTTVDKQARKPLSDCFPLDVDMMRDAADQTSRRSTMESVVRPQAQLIFHGLSFFCARALHSATCKSRASCIA